MNKRKRVALLAEGVDTAYLPLTHSLSEAAGVVREAAVRQKSKKKRTRELLDAHERETNVLRSDSQKGEGKGEKGKQKQRAGECSGTTKVLHKSQSIARGRNHEVL